MSSLSPYDFKNAGAATATLDRDTLQFWFASLGHAHRTQPATRHASVASTEGEATPDKRCPHPDRCRFAGCENDCHSPLPAA
jgi:hypothetical protein